MIGTDLGRAEMHVFDRCILDCTGKSGGWQKYKNERFKIPYDADQKKVHSNTAIGYKVS